MTDSRRICLIHLCKVVFLNFAPPPLSTVTLTIGLKTLLATLFNGSVHTSHMWSDLSSDMHPSKNVHNVASHVSDNVQVLLTGTVHTQTHVNAHLDTFT